ncbi:MAG: ecdysteroid 22-kinase family protein [Alphaproteobacteria bacterium]|nr:ecdysteroid 22-kinase family protein [Alphaproteobacteria bacterium]MBU1512857.1 ecdysteroid 22-kinase family protein [Alphaproteobacteria bacterium]MBU2096702.1 ecdysteroid 22-kinase family protein [Alphaproteobacteria bacterium]MBU2150585.1 ecdysteroid 22-kinase family protein [Alphaproteobacteria bacterium]MBU2308083.1 ecdysteroid 22-kinase family protein [Alphaproteobacteria bacterium]
MTKPDIRCPAAVDAAWLTAVLQGAGVDAVVAGFEANNVGTGQIGESVRFKLAYERDADDAPRSIVGKFPSPDDTSRGTGIMLGNYLREVRFYQQLAPRALVKTPRCWFTDTDETGGEFVLMMEDLAPAEQGDQLKGVTLDQARLVVEQAARLHASFWGDEGLDDLPWVQGAKAAPASAVTPEMVSGLWQAFRVRYADRLKPHWVDVGEAITANWSRFGEMDEGPRTLAHHDFRPDNMMFGTPAGGHPVTVLDWQSFTYAPGATDVAYFLAGALSPDVRRANEPAMLALYLAELTRLGVTGYSTDDLRRDYGRGGFQLFLTAFFAAMVVIQTERGDRMFLQMLGSAADHILDHGALAALS